MFKKDFGIYNISDYLYYETNGTGSESVVRYGLI